MKKYKIIKFGAGWCAPCKVQDKELNNIWESEPEKVSENVYSGMLRLGENAAELHKIDVDGDDRETLDLIEKHAVRSIPCIVILDEEGEVVKRWDGLTKSQVILNTIAQ